MIDGAFINIVLTFVVAIATVFLVNRLDAQSRARQARAEESKTDSDIDEANIKTALQLLDRVKKENLELSARTASLEQVAQELSREVSRLKDDLRESEETARVLYYQVRSLNETPRRKPRTITGPLEAKP